MIFFDTIASIFSIVLIIMTGYVFMEKGWLNQEVGKVFSQIITNLAIPSYMLWNLMSTFTKEKLIHIAPGLAVPFLSIVVCYIGGYLVAKLFGIKKEHQGTFYSMFAFSNTIFIGLPVNLALFGEESMPYVLLYYIANTTLFWTIGTNGIRKDGAVAQERGQARVNSEMLKKIFSPPLMGFMLAIVFILLDITLPHFLLDTFRYLGNMTTPLSMLFIGIAIYGVKLKNIKISKDMVVILLGRFVIAPLIILGITYALPLPILMKKVFIIQASLPVMTLTAVVAKSHQADAEYAAVMTTVTTISSMITIPIYMLIFQYYF